MLGLLDTHQAEFTINYYSLNLCTTVRMQPCNHQWCNNKVKKGKAIPVTYRGGP
jgi:hypothetical protein